MRSRVKRMLKLEPDEESCGKVMERRIRELEERLAEMESTGSGKKTPAAAEKESA